MISQWMILYSIRKLEIHSQAFQMSIFNARTLFQYNLTRQVYLKLFPPQFFKTFSILCLEDMFQYIQRGGSIVRFGDGEFSILVGKHNPGFQSASPKLRKDLKKVLDSDQSRMLICVPVYFTDPNQFRQLKPKSQLFWYRFLTNRHRWLEKNLCHQVYGNAQISRPYIDTLNKSSAIYVFEQFKKIFSGRKIVIIEGSQTRFGVGNDLLAGAKSVSRIIAPAVNAHDFYPEIKRQAEQLAFEDVLFIVCLGPTAKILTLELTQKGYQTLDLGHLDIEYEWFRRGVKEKILIPGKYVNEVQGHMTEDPYKDYEPYLKQIVAEIK